MKQVKKETKERMAMFMVEIVGKEIKIGIGINKKRMKWKKRTKTSLPYYLTKAYETPW